MPSPVRLETGRTGAPASFVGAIRVLDFGDAAGAQFVVGEVGFGQRYDAGSDAEQIDDLQMLDGLRHYSVIGGDHQKHEIDAGRAGEHVVDEALVTGHVDKAEHRAVRQQMIGIAEIDGDAAPLLLGKPVGIDAGQGFDEGGLAVVDMAGGTDDHAPMPPAEARLAASARWAGVAATSA